jgi:hypothetical protein
MRLFVRSEDESCSYIRRRRASLKFLLESNLKGVTPINNWDTGNQRNVRAFYEALDASDMFQLIGKARDVSECDAKGAESRSRTTT